MILGRHEPGPARTTVERHLARQDLAALGRLGTRAASLHDHLLRELAGARARERAGGIAGAVASLEAVRARRPRGESSLLLSVTRELARLHALPGSGCDAASTAAKEALRAYTAELEAELWSMHQARVLTLRARVAHDRLRRQHGQVSAQARSDPLTGLPNRRALDDVLARALARPDGRPPTVAMIDVDHFKGINDALSHARGDEVLRTVANALRGSLRADDVVARYGGDEFVIVLPRIGAPDARSALVRAARAVADLSGGSDEVRVSLAVGVVAALPGEDARAVLARADAAMYGVKQAGGDAVAAPGPTGAERPATSPTEGAGAPS